MYLIGFDIGSSFIKGAIFDSNTNEVFARSKQPADEMDIISRQSGWAEQMPEIWWSNLCTLTKKLLNQSKIPPHEIKGIGISYQMHGLVLIDKDHQVLRPSIIWCDSRAVSIGSEAFEQLGETYFQQNLLNSPGNFTISKLKWVKDNEPDIYKRIYKILLPGDYINMKLTGKVNTTISGLTEGMFWNYKEKRIAYEVLHHFDLDHKFIPEITGTFSVMGEVNAEAAAATGLQIGTPVTYRAGDQPNNALALNIMKPGEIAATSGTSGVLYGIVDKYLYDPQSKVNAFAHVNYEENFKSLGILLCLNGAGIQYAWVKHQIALSGGTYEDMERMVASVGVGSDGICILPFGNGAERIFDNKNLGSHIFNLDFNRHTRAHIYRASLEGVAFSFVYGVKFLKEMGLDVNVIRVATENMFQSKVFATTIATLLDANIEVVATNGAIGAARAAGVKAGIYPNIEAALNKIEIESTFFPDYN
ncbi:MAG TPA: FGGY family carbohydrate kinase, partial [Saprospiraceae bacterium]|nr:FGGY family carbohydrate kinase [Saprospiraceae bacterium]